MCEERNLSKYGGFAFDLLGLLSGVEGGTVCLSVEYEKILE